MPHDRFASQSGLNLEQADIGDKDRGQIVSPLPLSTSRLSTGGQCSLVDFGGCNIVEDLVCIGLLIQRLLEKVGDLG